MGISLKGEQNYEDMKEVLNNLHQYVPTVSTEEQITACVQGKTISKVVYIDKFDPILLGKKKKKIIVVFFKLLQLFV